VSSNTSLFPKTAKCIEQGIAAGLQSCAQVYISQYGETVASFAIGDFAPGRNCTEHTLMPWMSCSKMITAIGFALVYERRLVDFETPVSTVIPEFGCHGKEEITFTHILNHTAGIRLLSCKWDDISWEESIAAICEIPLEKDWVIGQDGGYHVGTSWFILGEAIQRLTGMSLPDYIQQEIFTPLKMDNCWLSMPTEIYEDSSREVARFYRTDRQPPKLALDKYAKAPNKCRPGASCRGPVQELGRFMEMLYGYGARGSVRLLSEGTIEKMIAVSREGIVDKTFQKVIDWGLGFMLDSKQYQEDYPYSFGPSCSDETFGHNGNQSSAAYVDAYHELVVCFAFNGLPGEVEHQKRIKALNTAIYEDMGIV
jgi:CubicO group peptidase (beta-lactamase class C family)